MEERDEAIFFGEIPAIADILILNLKDGSSGERCYTCSGGTLALQGDWICKSTPPSLSYVLVAEHKATEE